MRLRYSEVTPETLYLSRRELLAGRRGRRAGGGGRRR